ncbi:uncharacterized protein LOC113497916 [Trichoplusia ni]|uniref:Uncharacterized protein LOC113497916 n=1 Tax=Trichoplusia ni TaxID=7111 RepID=A0A7E5VZ06_TRINI|nr:uncharacterized protein LOC113497916 [Trichoplusia ni]
MNIDYDNIYKFKTLALKLNQCHPDIEKNKKWMIMFTIMHCLFSIIFLIVVYNVFYVDLKYGDFSKLCKDCALIVVYLEVTFNSLVFIRSQNSLKYLIDTMKNDFNVANSLNAEKQEIVMKNALHGAWIDNIWLVISVGGGCFFMLGNVIANIHSYSKGNFELVPLFDFEYPEFVNADDTVEFIINYALLTPFLAYSALMFASFVALGPSFILHAYGQLELSIREVENLFAVDGRDLRAKMKSIVQKQQNIYR